MRARELLPAARKESSLSLRFEASVRHLRGDIK